VDLNRRDLLKTGAAGFLLGFLFRGRDGLLQEQPAVVEQPPSAVTIRSRPQYAFRPSRLVIAGTVVGKRLVPETRFVPCSACKDWADQDEEDEAYCEACDNLGGTRIETGELIETDVTIVPWSIESLRIGSAEQFAQSGPIPGELFSASAVDTFVSLDAASDAQEIEMVVRYTGDKPDGEMFCGALIGTSLEGGVPKTVILPISSGQKIVA
jgi:hypothetical protein